MHKAQNAEIKIIYSHIESCRKFSARIIFVHHLMLFSIGARMRWKVHYKQFFTQYNNILGDPKSISK